MTTPGSDNNGGRRRWVAALTGVLVVGAVSGAILVAAPDAAAATGSGCIAATSGAQVHFLVDFAGADATISGLTITGFDSSACDGLPVTVVINGNKAGDPGQPADELLTTLDSTRDPCTNAELAPAVTVSGGTVTLRGCSSVTDPNQAAYADLHDATQLVVTVSGAVLPVVVGPPVTTSPPPSSTAASSTSAEVGGESTHRNGTGSAPASQTATAGSGGTEGQSSGPLASTGVRIALLLGFALLLIVVGLVILLPARRRHHG